MVTNVQGEEKIIIDTCQLYQITNGHFRPKCSPCVGQNPTCVVKLEGHVGGLVDECWVEVWGVGMLLGAHVGEFQGTNRVNIGHMHFVTLNKHIYAQT